jgi:hypothetical protein
MSANTSDARAWSDRVIPLPKEISVAGSAKVPASRIAVKSEAAVSPQIDTALDLVRPFALCGDPDPAFTITLVSGHPCPETSSGTGVSRNNVDQAYHIEPASGGKGLTLTAATPLGLLYAARTLAQLVNAPETVDAKTEIEIPLVTITDWPDIAERGQWGGDVTQHLSDIAPLKLNVIEHAAKVSVNESGEPVCGTSAEWIAGYLAQGVKIVPFISHLEQISRYTKLTNRPDVTSKPDPSKPLPSDYVPGLCMSSLATREIIRGWLDRTAEIEGVTDIMVWLSEERSPCFCDKCAGKEPFELEVQAITGAFEQIKSKHPNARLRLLTTQGSYNVNDKVLAAAPRDVGISYYDGGRTYDSSRRPMIYPLLEDFAKSGRWLGVYPQITHSWRCVFPWTGPQFIQCRAQEFADKKLSNVIGYAVPSNFCHDFNVTAMAEWTWNSRGRTPEEFARVYALKRGMAKPDLFAQWAMLAGDAGWSLAESKLMLTAIYNPTFGLLSGTPFDHRFQQASILDTGRLDEAISAARKALDLATSHGDPDMISESKCVLAGLESFQAIKAISDTITTANRQPSTDNILSDSLNTLDRTSETMRREVREWGERVRKRAKWGKLPGRLIDTANALLLTCDGFRAKAAELGVPDSHPERRLSKVGEWSAENFAKGPDTTIGWDITDLVPASGGTFNVAFDFIYSSAYGTDLKAVRIIEISSGDEKTLCTSDDPTGRLSRHEPHKEMVVTIPARSAEAKLFIELDCTGLPSDARADRRTCSGRVSLRQLSQ